jgi:hypothetical protein
MNDHKYYAIKMIKWEGKNALNIPKPEGVHELDPNPNNNPNHRKLYYPGNNIQDFR